MIIVIVKSNNKVSPRVIYPIDIIQKTKEALQLRLKDKIFK